MLTQLPLRPRCAKLIPCRRGWRPCKGLRPRTRPRAEFGQTRPYRLREKARSYSLTRLNRGQGRRCSRPYWYIALSHFQSQVWTGEANSIQQSKKADADPLCWLEFTKDSILASCKSGKSHRLPARGWQSAYAKTSLGHIRTWSRPSDNPDVQVTEDEPLGS